MIDLIQNCVIVGLIVAIGMQQFTIRTMLKTIQILLDRWQ